MSIFRVVHPFMLQALAWMQWEHYSCPTQYTDQNSISHNEVFNEGIILLFCKSVLDCTLLIAASWAASLDNKVCAIKPILLKKYRSRKPNPYISALQESDLQPGKSSLFLVGDCKQLGVGRFCHITFLIFTRWWMLTQFFPWWDELVTWKYSLSKLPFCPQSYYFKMTAFHILV